MCFFFQSFFCYLSVIREQLFVQVRIGVSSTAGTSMQFNHKLSNNVTIARTENMISIAVNGALTHSITLPTMMIGIILLSINRKY